MGRLFAALFLCALLLTALALPQKPAQPVFFSLLFEQLLPDWTPDEATPDEAEEACAWL